MEPQSRSHAEYEAKLEALHQHAKQLSDAGSIEEIAEFTAEAQKKTLGFTWAGVSIVEDNHIKNVISTRSGSRIPNGSPRLLDSPGNTTRAVRTGETELVAATRKDTPICCCYLKRREPRAERLQRTGRKACRDLGEPRSFGYAENQK